MMNPASHPISAVFLLGLLSVAGVATANCAPTLSEADVDRALDAIWTRLPAPEQRSPESAKRAALEEYVRKFGQGGGFFTRPPEVLTETEFPALKFHSETLFAGLGYVRLGAFNASLAGRMETALRDFKQLNTTAVLLDLRATPAEGDLALALELAGCFLPENTQVCELRTAKTGLQPVNTRRPPVGQFRLFLLTGPRTAGAVEAFAAALREKAGALIFGCKTAGQAVDFETVSLPSGSVLRVPVRETVFRGEPQLFPKGLEPDISVQVSQGATDAALLCAAKNGRVAPLLAQIEAPHFNEAALVAGKNPEAEAFIELQLKKVKNERPPERDRDHGLERVLDFLRAWDSLRGERETTTRLP
jgi:hypothetical protein